MSANLTLFRCAPTGADIRTDRRRHPHRPAQTSAPTDADIRIGRRRHPHRSAQTSASVDADGKRNASMSLKHMKCMA
ncbi:hypothetical protein [Leyella stercorea]|uniref:hypothetical protein n=1 Tax=Leyella stercorea TaxID=363265 RepID=UPI003A905752